MTLSTCRAGDRTSQRITALENELDALQAQLSQWQEFTPPLDTTGLEPSSAALDSVTGQAEPRAREAINLGAGGTRRGWFIRIGNRMHLRYAFAWGSPPWDGNIGTVISELPPDVRTDPGGIHYFHGHLWTTSGTEGNMDFVGSAFIHPGDRIIYWLFPRNAADCRLRQYTIAGPTAGNQAWSVPYIHTGYPEGGILTLQATLDVV